MKCTHCQSDDTIKYGMRKTGTGYAQRMRCKTCDREFSMHRSSAVKRAIVTPDKHFPLADDAAISVLMQAIELVKPEIYVDLGDVGEWSHFSRFKYKGKEKPPLEYMVNECNDDIIDVNPKDMQVTVEYTLEYFWIDNRWLELAKQDGLQDTYTCGFKIIEVDGIEYQYWLPDIGIRNKVSVIDMSYDGPERNLLVAGLTTDNDFFFERVIHETAIFNNPLDFSQFPFDRHDLQFQIETFSGYYEDFTFIPTYETEEQSYEFNQYVIVPEWNIGEITFFSSTSFWMGEDEPYDGFYYTIPIERQYLYYIYKLFIPILLIMIICWSVFWIHSKEIETRLTVTVVSFLTLIAYNYVIVDDIPKIDKLTVFDSTILLAYLYAALSSMISIFSFQHFNKTSIAFSNLDLYARFIGPLSFVVFVLVIFIYIFNKYSIAASLGLL